MQYTLAMIVRMLSEDATRAALFHQQTQTGAGAGAGSSTPDAYGTFSRLLQRADWFTQEKALYCLTKAIDQRPVKDMGLGAIAADPASGATGVIIGVGGTSGAGAGAAGAGGDEELGSAGQTTVQLVQWLCGQLRSPSHAERSVPSAVSALASLLAVRDVRPLVVRAGGVALLSPLLRSCSGPHNIQLHYEATLCVWLLTFHPPALAAMARTGAVTGLMEVARTASKEKVVRVAVLALRNIAEGGGGGGGGGADTRAGAEEGSSSSSAAVGVSVSGGGDAAAASAEYLIADETALRKVVQNLKLRDFTDEELTGALTDLEDGVLLRQKEASSWERYQREVLSGSLEWSAAHTDEGFWRESASKLTDNNCQLLRVLIKLLEASREPRTLAVALHDLGEFATHYPAGRFLVQDIGGKQHAMRLMVHADGEVRKQALLCTQKLLVANWKFIGQGGGAGGGGGGDGGAVAATA